MKRFDIRYHLREGFRSIFTHSFMSFAAVCMIVACLLIMGSFSLVAINMDHNLQQLEKENEFLAYIDETYTEEQARALQSQLEAVPNVASATFISRQDALEKYKEEQGNNELFNDLPPTVLRDRFSIHVHNIEQMKPTVLRVEEVPGVVNISVELEVAQGVVTLRNMATAIAGVLIIILLLVSLFIISNTIRLATFYRRDEIAIMKMCGATNWFIRGPFIVEGLLLGLIGAMAAFGLQWGVYTAIVRVVIETEGTQLLDILPFGQMALSVFGVFSGTGLVIGVGGSLLAIRKFLQV